MLANQYQNVFKNNNIGGNNSHDYTVFSSTYPSTSQTYCMSDLTTTE